MNPTATFTDFKNQWIEIFRAGDYGEKGEWTPEDLDQVVANFSAGLWTPPAVFGHPKEDSPAHGWVSALKREGNVLLARFNQVSPQLESSAKEGRFPNRSAAFYLDPKGSGPVLRHVGFLGATPPEIKGLRPIPFREGAFTSIDFTEEREQRMKTRDALMLAAEHNGGMLFGEAAKIAARDRSVNCDRIPISAASILMNERAGQIQRERKCDFGVALDLARREAE